MGSSPSKSFGESSQKVLRKQAEITASGTREMATFAGGCFWGIELAFQRVPGVVATEVGYTQGIKKSPTYEEVCSGSTGHTEAVQVVFDSNAIRYEDLLTVFWDIIDPTTLNRQGNDVGTQYRTGIYFHNESQRQKATYSWNEIRQKIGQPIATEVKPASEWYRAEDYHQHYLERGGQCSMKGDLTPIRCYG
eukprot:gene12561-16846_t